MANKKPQNFINTADKLFKRLLRQSLLDQGHYLTGALEKSIETKSEKLGNEYRIMVFMFEYGKFLNDGVEASKVTWKMFPGLIRYFKLRGYTEEDAKRIATFTIAKWQKEGMPTKDSARFSSTGKRKGFIDDAFSKDINTELSKAMDYDIETFFLNSVKNERI